MKAILRISVVPRHGLSQRRSHDRSSDRRDRLTTVLAIPGALTCGADGRAGPIMPAPGSSCRTRDHHAWSQDPARPVLAVRRAAHVRLGPWRLACRDRTCAASSVPARTSAGTCARCWSPARVRASRRRRAGSPAGVRPKRIADEFARNAAWPCAVPWPGRVAGSPSPPAARYSVRLKFVPLRGQGRATARLPAAKPAMTKPTPRRRLMASKPSHSRDPGSRSRH